jgi:glutathione peroxidase-family protein
MSEEIKNEEPSKRRDDLLARRASVGERVRPWCVGLTTNVSGLRNLADLEWNFESFYGKVKAKFAPSVTREELQDFLREKKINLKVKPKGGGVLGAWHGKK